MARAIKGGQAYLKAVYQPGGGRGGFGRAGSPPAAARRADPGHGQRGRSGALAGLALVETGVPANDPWWPQLARTPANRPSPSTARTPCPCTSCSSTGSGRRTTSRSSSSSPSGCSPASARDGSWCYTCPGLPLDPVEQRALHADLSRGAKVATPTLRPRRRKRSAARGPGRHAPAGQEATTRPPKEEEQPHGLHPVPGEVRPAVLRNAPGAGPASGSAGRATSGTTRTPSSPPSACGAGRRHHVACQRRPVRRWTSTTGRARGGTGGGGTPRSGGASSPAMTCAGLDGPGPWGSARSQGGVRPARRPTPSPRTGLIAGSKYVGNFLAAAGGQRDPRNGTFQANELSGNLYFHAGRSSGSAWCTG